MLKRRAGLVLLLSFGLTPGLAAAPLRITGRIVAPRSPTITIELRPLVSGYADGLRQLKGDPVPPLAVASPRPDGSFELLAPESGIYRVGVRADGLLPVEAQLIPLVEDTELPPVTLEPGAPIEITVLGPDGKPAAGARLRALPVRAFKTDADWRPAQSEGVTDPEGRLTLLEKSGEELSLVVLAPGVPDRYVEKVRAPRHTLRLTGGEPRVLEVRNTDGKPVPNLLARWNFMPLGVTGEDGRILLPAPTEGALLRLENARGRRAAVPVLPTAPARLAVRFPADRTAAGAVVDAATHQALPGALIWDDWHRTERADAQGHFRLRIAAVPEEASLSGADAGHVLGWARLPAASDDVALLLAPSATLSGTVTDARGTAVAGAEVRADPTAEGVHRQASWATAKSASDGRFRLTGLAADTRYDVKAEHKGFAPSRVAAETRREPPAPPLRIVLRSGSTATGTVVDESGQPVSGAEVRLAPVSEISIWPRRGEQRSTSDAAGRFHFVDLGSGHFDLWAARAGFSPTTRGGINVPTEPQVVDLGDVILAGGASVEGRVTDRRGRPVEGAEVSSSFRGSMELYAPRPEAVVTGADGRFRLGDLRRDSLIDLRVSKAGFAPADLPGVKVPSPEPLRVELAAARVLSGRVLNSAGEPVPEALIYRIESQEIRSGGHVASASTGMKMLGTTDRDGRFRLSDLDEGSLDLMVSASGFKSRNLLGVETREDDGSPLEIVLNQGESVEGRLTDGHGSPVPGARISAQPARPSMFSGPQRAVSGSDGRYRLSGLDPGRVAMEARGPNGSTASAELEVQPGVNRLDLTLGETIEVEGRIVDGAGSPVGGAWVRLWSQGPGLSQIQEGASAADGSFRVRAASDGDYQISAGGQGFAETTSAEPVHVAGAPVRGLELVLQRGAVLSGKLRGFAPEDLAALRIFAQLQPGSGRAGAVSSLSTTASGDSYRIAGLVPGTWTVIPSASGGSPASGTVVVEPGMESVTLDLEAPGGLTLSGRVLVDGSPLAGAQVVAEGAGSMFTSGSVATAYDGSFRLSGLPPGGLRVMVSSSDGLGLSREIDLREDRDVLLEIATGAVEGRILTAAGQPVAEAVVRVDGDDPELGTGFSGPSVRSDEQGGFALTRLAAGSYKVTVQKAGFAPAETRIEVTPGGTVETEVILKVAGGG